MSTIVTRQGKGTALTYAEADANFTNLNNDKLEASSIGATVQAYDANLTSFVNTFTLPTSDSTSGYVLSTDGSGSLGFIPVSSSSGTVTSVDMTVPTGLSIAGNPITTSGTLAITYTSGYSIPTTTKQTEWDSAYTERRQWDGGSTNLNAATGRTSLELGTLATQSGTFSGTSSGTNTGDQNLFGTISVSGQSDVIADSTSDTLTLVAGSNVTITTDAGTDSITIAASSGGSSTLTIDNKTSAYTVVAGDLGKIINCTSGTFTVSLTAAATLGAGFNCWIWNTGTGVITINPDGTETVDGVDPTTEFKLVQGTGIRIVCNGTGWLTTDSRLSGDSSLGVLGTQLGRNSVGDMAVAKTGQGAMALGGSYASGTDSFAAGVANNTSTYGAQGANSIAIGNQARASSSNTIAIGRSATASAAGAIAISATGTDPITASAAQSVAIGGPFTEATQFGSYAMGAGGKSKIRNKFAFGYDNFGSANSAQSQKSWLGLIATTTNATPIQMTANAAAATTTNKLILEPNSANAFTGIVVARQQAAGGTASAAWKIEGLIRREGTAASTTLVTSTVTAISNVPAWTLDLSVDTTNGGLTVTATGAAATNIRWLADIDVTELNNYA